MSHVKKLEDIISENNGMVQTKDLKKCDIPTVYLTRMVNKGELIRVSPGIYVTPTGDYDEYYFFSQRYSRAIYSHVSALYLHNLTDVIPQYKEITLPSGYNAHRITEAIEIHYIKTELHELGLCEVETMFCNPVKVYNLERTICDMVADRANQDTEVFADAVNRYARWSGKNTLRLYEYAQKLNVLDRVIDVFEILF